MLFIFLMGVASGGLVGWFFWWSARREVQRMDEEKQLLSQEKMIVFDFMHNMVEAVGEGIQRNELFRRVVHASILSTGALSACIFELQGNRLRGVAVEGLFPPHRPLPESSKLKITTRTKFLEQILKSETFAIGEGIVGRVARSGKGVLIEDARNDPQVVRHDDPALEVRSLIVVPLRFREKTIAVLAIVNPSDGGSFGETAFSLAQSIGEQAGLAVHNLDLLSLQIEKNKIDSDLGLAREIQSMLLPRTFPSTEYFDIAATYLPAQKVGGDLYDIFTLPDSKVGLAIADVSGKGISASLLMAICQSNLRHFAQSIESPAEVLIALNKVLVEEMKPEMFVTILYVVADPHSGSLTIARAGHELPILVHKDGASGSYRAEFIGSEGMAAGMVPSTIFNDSIVERILPFLPGDVLTLFTDGVTESVNSEGTEFSNGRLADVTRTLRSRSAADLNQGITDRVELFTGPEGRGDDFTLVTIKRLGEEGLIES